MVLFSYVGLGLLWQGHVRLRKWYQNRLKIVDGVDVIVTLADGSKRKGNLRTTDDGECLIETETGSFRWVLPDGSFVRKGSKYVAWERAPLT
jgi:hypothetical protein